MEDEDRFKAWAAYAEISRKWATTMDAKAGFVTALNMGLLALLWSGAKIQDGGCWVKILGAASSIGSIASILCAIWAALPRDSLATVFGGTITWHSDYKPLSFYGYVAQAFGARDFAKMKEHAETLSHAQVAEEALEQHFVISHAVARKAGFVKLAGLLLMGAALLTGISIFLRLIA